MNAKEPNWEDAASEILTILLPLLLKASRDNDVSMDDLGGFRSRIVEILRKEAEKNVGESA